MESTTRSSGTGSGVKVGVGSSSAAVVVGVRLGESVGAISVADQGAEAGVVAAAPARQLASPTSTTNPTSPSLARMAFSIA